MSYVIMFAIAMVASLLYKCLGWNKEHAAKKEEIAGKDVPFSNLKIYKTPSREEISGMSINEFCKELINALGAEILYTSKNDYVINYHGGVFTLGFNENCRSLSITFPGFAGFKHEDEVRAHEIANRFNSNGSSWRVYITFDPKEEEPLLANCSFLFHPLGTMGECMGILKDILNHPFSIARNFNDMMKKRAGDNDSVEMRAINRDVIHNIYYNQYQRIVAASQGDEKTFAGKHTIANLLALSPDVDFGCIEGLRIVTGVDVKSIDNVDEIMEFNIKNFIISNPQHNRLTLLLDFEKESLLIDLKKALGGDERHLFYHMSVARNGNVTNREKTDAESFCFHTSIAINLTTDKEDTWEAKYMIGEGCLPVSLNALSEDDQKDYYWGAKLYNAGNYLQALPHLKRVYKNLPANDQPECSEVYGFVSLMIGVIYMKLNMPDTAYLYLDTAAICGSRVICLSELAHCISRINRPDSISTILNMHEVLMKRIEVVQEDENVSIENTLMARCFLNRVLVGELIKNKIYDRAKDMLQKMIENEDDVEFAREMLEKVEEEEGKMS